jgi:hypothetical protein
LGKETSLDKLGTSLPTTPACRQAGMPHRSGFSKEIFKWGGELRKISF